MGGRFIKNALLLVAALLFSSNIFAGNATSFATIAVADLPPQGQQTLLLIKHGGPFPYAKDGAVFGNYEEVLPKRKRGYYHEFTVETVGTHNRGARRVISGGSAGGASFTQSEYYYTDDHYKSFRRIKE